jgi:hypothetical protein
MNNFIFTERKDNIFYGDIFRISNKTCLVMGKGKSKAGSEAVDKEEDRVALDFSCLTRNDDTLFGHFEMEIRNINNPDPINERKPINYLVRMLGHEETITYFGGQVPEIRSVSLEEFITLSKWFITYSIDMMTMEQRNDNSKLRLFRSLTEGANIEGCIIVPWMESHESKGEAIKKFLDNI